MDKIEISDTNMEAAERLLATAAVDHAELWLAVGLGPAGADGKARPVLYLLQPGLTFAEAHSLMAHVIAESRAGRQTAVGPGQHIPDWWLKGGPPPAAPEKKGGGG